MPRRHRAGAHRHLEGPVRRRGGHHRGRLAVGDHYENASPLGTVFRGRIRKTVAIGKFNGIVAQIRGNAQITGYHQFVLDPRDPFQQGFLL